MSIAKPNSSEGPRGLIISAPRSGSGKTTVTLGLMRALRQRGHVIQPFKSGPDYIDPAFHKAATGRTSINLDTWSMRPELLQRLIHQSTADAELAIVEGAMGLFDGVNREGQSGHGATADLAAFTGWPVILVLDVSGQGATAAAIALGCANYRDDVTVSGVILNQVASARHEHLIVPAIEATGIPVLASLSRSNDRALPHRHLGLVQATETNELNAILDALGEAIDTGMRVDDILDHATPARLPSNPDGSHIITSIPPPGQRIALASDRAFSFVYPHLLDGWREQGAQIRPFSPLANEPPDATADVIWLPGGYPELHAGVIAAAGEFHSGMHAHAERGTPIHGECGGYMVLGAGLEDKTGARHKMLGLLGLETSFATPKLHLGYRRSKLMSNTVLGASGDMLFGHEFHYARVTGNTDAPFAKVFDATGNIIENTGSKRANVTGTFFHVIDRAQK